MLQGHVRMATYKGNDGDRIHCNDVTLDNLELGGGTGFLDLLDVFAPLDIEVPIGVARSFPRPGLGPVPGADSKRNALHALLVVTRDSYLCKYVIDATGVLHCSLFPLQLCTSCMSSTRSLTSLCHGNAKPGKCQYEEKLTQKLDG